MENVKQRASAGQYSRKGRKGKGSGEGESGARATREGSEERGSDDAPFPPPAPHRGIPTLADR